jgi:hypothetical protein
MIEFSNPVTYIVLSGIFLVILSFFLIPNINKLSNKQKKIFFSIMVIPIVFSSLFLAGHTVYENLTSITKGPVHWHADYEVWACGEKLDLVDPEGMSNRIGTSVFHEHGDNRMHVEGVIRNLQDANLENYFKTVG